MNTDSQLQSNTIPTREEVRALEDAWFAIMCEVSTFDEAIAEPHATQQQNAHTRYMIAKSLNENAPLLMPCEELIAQMKKEEAATPATPTPAPVSAEAETARTGRVSCYDAKNDYGYIVSKGQSFYFQKRHLKHSNMPIKGGDVVTFSVWESRTGMPKATGIVVEGYVAPKNAAVERAQEEARKNAEREARRKAILEAGRANRQSALKAQGA